MIVYNERGAGYAAVGVAVGVGGYLLGHLTGGVILGGLAAAALDFRYRKTETDSMMDPGDGGSIYFIPVWIIGILVAIGAGLWGRDPEPTKVDSPVYEAPTAFATQPTKEDLEDVGTPPRDLEGVAVAKLTFANGSVTRESWQRWDVLFPEGATVLVISTTAPEAMKAIETKKSFRAVAVCGDEPERYANTAITDREIHDAFVNDYRARRQVVVKPRIVGALAEEHVVIAIAPSVCSQLQALPALIKCDAQSCAAAD